MSEATGERIVRLETQISSIEKTVNHLDECVDALKRQIWKASGGLSIIVLAINLLMKHL